MFFVMVEISNYRQLSRLRSSDASEIRGLLEHFGQNRGGRLSREQNGFFLFNFHPLREKVLDQVSDFLFLTAEALQRKKDDLFGFSLLLEQDDQVDEASVFNRLKALVFLAPRENRVWAGPAILPALSHLFPVSGDEPLAEILGPQAKADLPPLPVNLLLEMTGWIEALKTPLSRQLSDSGDGKQGKILRLKGSHLLEKYFVLKTVLHQLYGVHEDFPVLFPLEDSRDFLSQLLARIDPKVAVHGSEPVWESLLSSRGSGDYPGDSGREDVVGALTLYFQSVIQHLANQGLPPVFVFLFPRGYEPAAQAVLETILGDLVAHRGLRLLLLEPQDTSMDFLGRHPSLSWAFPPLSLERILRERDARGWQDRFPSLERSILEACEGRGMAWVHHLWLIQEKKEANLVVQDRDPSWALLCHLDSSHHKVYFVLWASRGLLEESQLVPFFASWGEDPSVIHDKVESLRSMGFFLKSLSQPLRTDFGPRLHALLGAEAGELLVGLGQFLHHQWTRDHRLSEVLFAALWEWGLHHLSVEVLTYYLTSKINQGQSDFLPLLRRKLWDSAPTEEIKDSLRLVAASAKLRFALNLRGKVGDLEALARFRRYFTPRTETNPSGEWLLQQGRFFLSIGELVVGFSLLKKALLLAQEYDDKSLEIRAETEIGLTLMRKIRLEEGREYFDIASRLAEKLGSVYLIALTSSLEAVAAFLTGHITTSLQAVSRGKAACERGGLQQRKVFLGFLEARIAFDQGDYPRARQALEGSLVVAERYQFPGALPVLLTWKARVEGYSGNPSGAAISLEAMAPSPESSYYLAEAAYMVRDYPGALEHILRAKALIVPTQAFGIGEQVDWSSGYSNVEDRALHHPGDMGVLENQIEGFHGLLEGLTGHSEESARRFQALLSRKFLLDLDPNSALYYYWYYLTLSKNEAKQEAQRLTLLGRSLKDVQVRSSRIEDPVQRHDYLAKPYWNAQFGLEARKFKLL